MNENIFDNNDLSVGVIYEETLGNKNLKFKLVMNDENIEMDNGLLSIYCMMKNENIPENIHWDLNDLWNGDFIVKVYDCDRFWFERRFADCDTEDLFEFANTKEEWEYHDKLVN